MPHPRQPCRLPDRYAAPCHWPRNACNACDAAGDFHFFGYGWLVNDLMTLWQQFCLLVDGGRIVLDMAGRNFAHFIATSDG